MVSSLGVLYRFSEARGLCLGRLEKRKASWRSWVLLSRNFLGMKKRFDSFLRLFGYLRYLNEEKNKRLFYTKTTSLHHVPSGILQRAHTV